jgi:trimeric autotransporter adhesin
MRRQQQLQEHNEGADTAARIANSIQALKLGTRRRSSSAMSARLPEQSPLQPRRVASVQRKAPDLAVRPLEATAAALSDLSDVESLTDDFELEYQSHVRNAAFRKALHTSLSASLTNALSAGATPQRKAANGAVDTTEDQFDDDAISAFRVAALASSFAGAASPAAAARLSPTASRATRTSPPCETCGARSSERADTVAGRQVQQQQYSNDYAADDSGLEMTSNIELSSCPDTTGVYNDDDDAGAASPAAARLLDFLQSVERPAASAQRSPHHDVEQQQWRGSGSRSPQRRHEQRAEESSYDVSPAVARSDAALFAESLLRSEHSAVGADEQLLSALAARVLSRLCQETLQHVGVRRAEHTATDTTAAAGERDTTAQSQQRSSNSSSSSKKKQSRSTVRVLRVKRCRQPQRSAKKSAGKLAARSIAAAAAADTSSDTAAVVADADDSAASAAADLSIYAQHRAEMDCVNGAVQYLQSDVRHDDEVTSVSPISSVSTAANVVTTDTPTAYGAVAAAEHTAAAPAAATAAAAARRGRPAHPSRRRLFDEAADAESSSSSRGDDGAATAAATAAAALAAAEEDCSCSTAGDEREDRVLQQRAGGASPMSSVSPVPVFGVITTDSPTMYGAARHHSHSAGRMPWRPAHVDSTAVGTTSDSSGSSISGDSEGCTNTDGSLQRSERYSSTLATSAEPAVSADTTAASTSAAGAAAAGATSAAATTVQQQASAAAVHTDSTAASEHVADNYACTDNTVRADSAQRTDDEQQPVAASAADWSIDDTELDTHARHAMLEGLEELARAERSAAPLTSSPPSLRLHDSPSPLQQQQQQQQQQRQQQQQQRSPHRQTTAEQYSSSAAHRKQQEQSSSSDANMSYIELYLSGLSRSSAPESGFAAAARTPLPPPRRSALVDEPASAIYSNSSSSSRPQQVAAAVSYELSNMSGLSLILRHIASPPSYAHTSTYSSDAAAAMNGAAPKLQLLAPNRQRWLDDLKQRYHIIGSGNGSAEHTSNGHGNRVVPAAQLQQQQQQQYGTPQRATNSSASSSRSRVATALRQPAASPLAHVDVDKWLASKATPAQQHTQSQQWSPRSQSPPRARGTTAVAAAAAAVHLVAERSSSRIAAVAVSPRNPLLSEYSSGNPLFETSTAVDSAVRLGYASMLSPGSERNSASGRLNASFYSSVGSSSACAPSSRKLRTVYRDRSGNVIVTDVRTP